MHTCVPIHLYLYLYLCMFTYYNEKRFIPEAHLYKEFNCIDNKNLFN